MSVGNNTRHFILLTIFKVWNINLAYSIEEYIYIPVPKKLDKVVHF